MCLLFTIFVYPITSNRLRWAGNINGCIVVRKNCSVQYFVWPNHLEIAFRNMDTHELPTFTENCIDYGKEAVKCLSWCHNSNTCIVTICQGIRWNRISRIVLLTHRSLNIRFFLTFEVSSISLHWLVKFRWCLQTNGMGSYWWYVYIGSGNSLVPSGNNPLPEPIFTKVYNTIWCN